MELDSGGLAVPDTSVIHATKGSWLLWPLGLNQKMDCVNCAMPEMYCGQEGRQAGGTRPLERQRQRRSMRSYLDVQVALHAAD